MNILLDMSSRMQVMEEYVAQQNPINLTGNQGPILDMRGDHARLNAATTTSSARVAASHMGSAGTITLWMANDMSTDCAQLNGAATSRIARTAAGCLETSGTIALRVAEQHRT